MKLIIKTLGWAVISGSIFFVSALVNSCPLDAAIVATLVATLSKTPAYPIWEIIFDRLWNNKKNGCFLGEHI